MTARELDELLRTLGIPMPVYVYGHARGGKGAVTQILDNLAAPRPIDTEEESE